LSIEEKVATSGLWSEAIPQFGMVMHSAAKVRIRNRFHPLVSSRERKFFPFVRGSGANHADDGDETIDFVDRAHATKTRHGRTFNVMDGSRPAFCNHLPDAFIAPRLDRLRIAEEDSSSAHVISDAFFQIDFDASVSKHRFDITHRSQSALSKNVHLHQAIINTSSSFAARS
jgi:hypothetical protein